MKEAAHGAGYTVVCNKLYLILSNKSEPKKNRILNLETLTW